MSFNRCERMKQLNLTPMFVEFIPEELQDGVLYISKKYKTAVHKCCCGCGQEVVTPLSPAEWQLRLEQGGVSLTPSIGNWGFPCQSHYWIKRNRVEWAGPLSAMQIAKVRAKDRVVKENYINQVNRDKPKERWIVRIKHLFSKLFGK